MIVPGDITMRINELLVILFKLIGFSFIVGTIIYAILLFRPKYRNKFTISMHIIRLVFISYFCLLLLILFMPLNESYDVSNNRFLGSSIYLALYNRDAASAFGIICNIILFIPMGIALPYIFKKIDKLWKVILFSALASLLIELIQLLIPAMGRSFDVDDIFCNAIGSILGFSLFVIYSTKVKKQSLITHFSKNTYIGSILISSLIIVGIAVGGIVFTEDSHGRLNIIRIGDLFTCEISIPTYEYVESGPVYIGISQECLMKDIQNHFGLNEDANVDPTGQTLRTNVDCIGAKDDNRIQLIVNKSDNSWMANIKLAEEWIISSKDRISAEATSFLNHYSFDNVYIDNIQIDSKESATIECKTLNSNIEGKMQISYTNYEYPSVEIISNIKPYSEYKVVNLKRAEDALNSQYACSVTSNDSGPDTSYDFAIKNPTKIIIKSVQLIYLYDNITEQFLPAWKYIGTAYDKEDSEAIYIIEPASE